MNRDGSEIVANFQKFWQTNFPKVPPLPERLRDHYFKTRWLRFHALKEIDPLIPREDRNTEAEADIYVERANALATRVLGIGSACWMVANYISDEIDSWMKYYPNEHRSREIFSLKKSFTFVDSYEEPEDQVDYRAYVSECIWRPGNYDKALRLTEDDVEDVLWISKDTKAVFAPYDRGFDLILPNSHEIGTLKRQFSDWLFDHPDGL
ncbi:MAG: hypothetical protein ISR50_19670 [Alphaproteobacteria bacterium]|nr:hypothetical protein [Alphaproteobacteria bacterium]